jgi:peptidoglycan hydrolase CwlO-like protein
MFSKNRIKINNITKLLLILLVPVLLFSLNFSAQKNAQADELDDLIEDYCKDVSEEECDEYKEELEDTEDEMDDLEDELENAKKLAKLKREQAKTLENQVGLLNLEINNVQGEINTLEGEISTTEEKINQIVEEIDKKNKNIENYKGNLGEMLRSYQKLNHSLGLSFVSKESSLTDVFNRSDYLSQVSDKINVVLKIIKEEKETLRGKRDDLEIEKGKLDIKKSEMDEQKSALASKKYQKNSLLTRTKGEEAEYQALIDKIESQMKQLLIDVGSLTAAEQGELNDILEDADEPKEGKASESWHYYQIDSRWKNKSLGGSRYTIGDSGCAITSIAMVGKFYGDSVKPSDLSSANFFSDRPGEEGYIDWYEPEKEFDLKIIKKTGHSTSNFSSSEIKDYIEDDIPVIAYISAGGPGHYVVIHGYDSKRKDFVVHDPYWGANLLLETSKKLVATLHKRSVYMDQIIVYEED